MQQLKILLSIKLDETFFVLSFLFLFFKNLKTFHKTELKMKKLKKKLIAMP